MIKSKDYADRECVLCFNTGEPVEVDDSVADSRGDKWIIDGGSAPRHEASTGRVYVHQIVKGAEIHMSYFPGVFGMEWVVCR